MTFKLKKRYVNGKVVYSHKRYKKQKTLYTLSQVNNRESVKKDKLYKALRPGKRISKTGKKYVETRANRSDKRGKLI